MSYQSFRISKFIRDQFDLTKNPVRSVQRSLYTQSALANRENFQASRTEAMLGPLMTLDASIGGCRLRTAIAHALQEFIVCSVNGGVEAYDLAGFWDQLRLNAGTTITKVLQDVSLNRAMAVFLTHYDNRKADPVRGSTPDENYAREILQLFCIGLVQLEMDGTVKTDGNGNPLPTYSPEDVTGLAEVFTGLVSPDMLQSLYDAKDPVTRDSTITSREGVGTFLGTPMDTTQPMYCYADEHEWAEKRFLDIVVPAVTDPAQQTMAAAQQEVRDVVAQILQHPNVMPFVALRLIQQMRRYNPSPAYVRHVAEAGAAGTYILPDGDPIGSGERGDLQAMISAVLCYAGYAADYTDPNAGRVLNPWRAIVAMHAWHSGKDELYAASEDPPTLRDYFDDDDFMAPVASREGMSAMKAPMYQDSVFGFGEPLYIPAGTPAGDAQLYAPGLQAFSWGEFETIYENYFSDNFTQYVLSIGQLDSETGGKVRAINAEIIADSAAYVDRMNAQAFGGRLSVDTVNVLKAEAAYRVNTPTTVRSRMLIDTPDGGPGLGGVGLFAAATLTMEGLIIR